MREIIADGVGCLIDFDRPFWMTFKRLLTAPGALTRDYIAGQRQRYASPFRVFLIFATLSTIAWFVVTGGHTEFLPESPTSGVLAKHQTARQWAMDTLQANQHLINILVIPVLAVAYKPLFRKQGYNLAEHTAGVFYVYGVVFFVEFITKGWIVLMQAEWLAQGVFVFTVFYPMVVAVRIYQAGWISGLLRAFIGQVVLYAVAAAFGLFVVFVLPPLISPFFPEEVPVEATPSEAGEAAAEPESESGP